ncbi:MAG: hypothetical protein KME30_14815 [Iphinoe sp. HA4291-MV1]|nr:hypothetical protein [Iphinoe sp. HA4291-MV1]
MVKSRWLTMGNGQWAMGNGQKLFFSPAPSSPSSSLSILLPTGFDHTQSQESIANNS